jgi:hypothetical protein
MVLDHGHALCTSDDGCPVLMFDPSPDEGMGTAHLLGLEDIGFS